MKKVFRYEVALWIGASLGPILTIVLTIVGMPYLVRTSYALAGKITAVEEVPVLGVGIPLILAILFVWLMFFKLYPWLDSQIQKLTPVPIEYVRWKVETSPLRAFGRAIVSLFRGREERE